MLSRGFHRLTFKLLAAFAVIYALYFFPWRLLRRDAPARVSSAQPV